MKNNTFLRKNQKLNHVQTTCKSVHPCSDMIPRQSCGKDSTVHALDVPILFGTKKMECQSPGTTTNEVYLLFKIVPDRAGYGHVTVRSKKKMTFKGTCVDDSFLFYSIPWKILRREVSTLVTVSCHPVLPEGTPIWDGVPDEEDGVPDVEMGYR